MYADLISALAKARDAQGLTLAQAAKRIGKRKTKQHLWNWEQQRARPSVEDLASWAGALGFRLVLGVVPADAPVVPHEVTAALTGLSPADQRELLRFARVLRDSQGITRRLLLRYVEDVASELDAAESATG